MHLDGTAHGGTAIFIKNNIKYHKPPRQKHIQVINIGVKDWISPLVLSIVHCSLRYAIRRSSSNNSSDRLDHNLWQKETSMRNTHSGGSRLITSKVGSYFIQLMLTKSQCHLDCPVYLLVKQDL